MCIRDRFYTVTPTVRDKAALLAFYGGSPIGNSRVKLTNAKDLSLIHI